MNSLFKKILSLFIVWVLMISLVTIAYAEEIEMPQKQHKITSLDNTKIMVIGNSMLYYGNFVIPGSQGKEDKGYLYQLITQNGEKTTVIDHTYGGARLSGIYEEYLKSIPADELKEYDYVVLSEWAKVSDNFIEDCNKIMSLFPAETKFYYMCHSLLYEKELVSITSNFDTLREMGVEIVNWGGMTYDIYTNNYQIPDSEFEYNRETFIKNNVDFINGEGHIGKDKNGDSIHPNPLSAYIAAQMLYSAMTNKPALYENYSFCNNKTLSKYFTFEGYISAHYTGTLTTNFDKIFASPTEMLRIQKTIDYYNHSEGRHSYIVSKGFNATCTSVGLTDGVTCSVCKEEFAKQEIIPAIGGEHIEVIKSAVNPTCTKSGKSVEISCSKCNTILCARTVLEPLGHTEEKTIVPATQKSNGKVIGVCTVCQEEVSERSIAKIGEISLSEKSFVYNGKERKPTVVVKNVNGYKLTENTHYKVTYEEGRIGIGKYSVKITFLNKFSGTKTLHFKINPKATSLKKITKGKKSLTISWNRQKSQNVGYQIQCSENSNFKNSREILISKNTKVKRVIKKLGSNKLYYIRIRTVKTVNDKVFYSKWSKALSKKTKK